MKGILKNCVVIDLTQFNYENLSKAITTAKLTITIECLITNKKNGFAKLFIDRVNMAVIAFTTKKNNQIEFSQAFIDGLQSMESVKLTKNVDLTELSFDDILEKISSKGIGSLSKREKDYLDAYSQKI